MSSFLAKCPQCGCTFAAGSPCPECRWVDSEQDIDVNTNEHCLEFAKRQNIHKRNSTIHMILMAATGFVGLATAMMWTMFIYQGSIFGFILIGFLTVASGVLAACTYLARSNYPTTLLCPACDSDLNELEMDLTNCPACAVTLISKDTFSCRDAIRRASRAQSRTCRCLTRRP